MGVTLRRKCPNCGRPVVGHPNKKFCNSKCKDRYHNVRNPRGVYAHLAYGIHDEHPLSEDGLGQSHY